MVECRLSVGYKPPTRPTNQEKEGPNETEWNNMQNIETTEPRHSHKSPGIFKPQTKMHGYGGEGQITEPLRGGLFVPAAVHFQILRC